MPWLRRFEFTKPASRGSDFEDVELPAPGAGQVRVKQAAAGINYIDTYFRAGAYPPPGGHPFIAGNEGSGDVIAVGSGVTDLKVGDRIAAVFPLGGYAAERNVPADRAVKVPANISRPYRARWPPRCAAMAQRSSRRRRGGVHQDGVPFSTLKVRRTRYSAVIAR